MKKFTLFLLALTLFLTGNCNKQNQHEKNLQTLIQAEHAFARLSADSGMGKAFITWLAGDAVVFRPDPVTGKKLYQQSPNIPGMLLWQPHWADVSMDGDLGYTSGPWEYRSKGFTDSSHSCGHYVSVWKRDRGGKWKVVVDVGISNNCPAYLLQDTLLQVQLPPFRVEEKPAAGNHADLIFLLMQDQNFTTLVRDSGTAAAYRKFASPEIMVFRDHHLPMISLKGALDSLIDTTTTYAWDPTAADMARSGDLGYSYGIGLEKNAGPEAGSSHKFSYLHIWRNDSKQGWQLVLDITNPIP
jgi:ketosteroid isomerase-like protein